MSSLRGESSAEQRVLPAVDSLWKYDDPAGTERRFLDLVPAARGSGDEEYLAQLLTQIARSQILQRRFEDGHATLDEVLKILSDRTPVGRIRYLLERGRAWNDVGNKVEAAGAFQAAFALAYSLKSDALAIDAAHMLGVMPPYKIAVDWNRKAVAIAERSEKPGARGWIGTLYMNMGVNQQRIARYADAERAFGSAICAFEQSGNVARTRLAKLCLAKNQRLRGDAGGAIVHDRELLAEMEAAGEPVGYALEEIAECLLVLGRGDEARGFFARAYAALSADPWYPPNEGERLERLRELGM